MHWTQRIEPTFDKPTRNRSRRQPASRALAPAPACSVPAIDPFADVRPKYRSPVFEPEPQIDYSRLTGGASSFSILLVICLAVGVIVGLAHTGPQFWHTVGTALEWVFGIALVIGFIAVMAKYPNLARAVVAFSFLLVAIGWLFRDDRDDRRRYY